MAIQPKNDTEIKVDTISEKSSAAGVTIDGVLVKDNDITATDATLSGSLLTDTISEASVSNGVDIEGVKVIDSYAEFTAISAPGTPASNKVRLYDTSGSLVAKNSAGSTWSLMPARSTWVPSYTPSGGMTFTTTTARFAWYQKVGEIIYFQVSENGTTSGTADPYILLTPPVTPNSGYSSSTLGIATCLVRDASSGIHVPGICTINDSDGIRVYKSDASDFGIGVNRSYYVSGFYFI